jgi:transglutaminase-like putative cysteine protease
MIRRIFIGLSALWLTALGPSLLSAKTVFASAERQEQRSPALPASSGTLVLSGYMRSRATITMTGAFSVGHLTNLNWDLPYPTSLRLSGYEQRVRRLSYRFSVQPTSVSTVSTRGHLVRRFGWAAPPANTIIRVRETVRLGVVSRLTPFHSRARYPLAQVPAFAEPYLQVTPMLRLKHHKKRLARRLAEGKRTERAVVASVANYIASTTRYAYAAQPPQSSASWTLSHHLATCEGFANAMAALLRALGIPSQVEYGWVSAAPLNFPAPRGLHRQLQWGPAGSAGQLHVWLNIYFPHAGWVPFDPQLEKFFIDPRHFSFYTNVDAGDPGMGLWSAYAVGNQAPTRNNLRYGLSVIVPGDGYGSRVSLSSQDDFHVGLRRTYNDVHNVLLFQR